MAHNLSTTCVNFISIYKVVEYNADRWRLGVPRYDKEASTWLFEPRTPIDYEIHLLRKTLGASINADMANPSQDVGLFVKLRAASAIGRPSNTTVVYFRDELYCTLTWNDILGKAGQQCGLRRCQDYRLVLFVQKITNPEHRQLLIDAISVMI